MVLHRNGNKGYSQFWAYLFQDIPTHESGTINGLQRLRKEVNYAEHVWDYFQ